MDPPVTLRQQTLKPTWSTGAQVDQHALIHAVSGTMRLEAEGQRWSLLQGEAALIAADTTVSVSVPKQLTAVWVHFAPGFIPAPAQALSVFDVSPLARELLLALARFETEPPTQAALRMFRTLGDVVLALSATPSVFVLPMPTSPALAQAMALAEGQLENLPSFGEVARETGQSTRSLTRRCTEELGISWRDLIRRMRMIRAGEALATTDTPVAEIAVMVGYSALSGFNEAFRDLTGQNPSEFRANLRGTRG